MSLHQAIGFLSTIALFLPVFVILFFRMFRYKNYLALLAYVFYAFVYNLMTVNYINVPRDIERYTGIINNFLDFPLMFMFIMLFSTSKEGTKKMKMLLIAYILFELIIVAINGLTILSITIVMGPGVLLVFGYCLYFFAKYIKRSFANPKATGKALMASALCFAYGCFTFIYIMYYIFKVTESESSYIFVVYFTITIIYCSLLTAGIVIESKRKRKLEELLVTRKELLRIFGEEKKPVVTKEATGQWKFN